MFKVGQTCSYSITFFPTLEEAETETEIDHSKCLHIVIKTIHWDVNLDGVWLSLEERMYGEAQKKQPHMAFPLEFLVWTINFPHFTQYHLGKMGNSSAESRDGSIQLSGHVFIARTIQYKHNYPSHIRKLHPGIPRINPIMIIKLYRIEQETSTNQSSQLPLRLLKEMESWTEKPVLKWNLEGERQRSFFTELGHPERKTLSWAVSIWEAWKKSQATVSDCESREPEKMENRKRSLWRSHGGILPEGSLLQVTGCIPIQQDSFSEWLY